MLSFIKNKLLWASTLKPGDIIEDVYFNRKIVSKIEKKFIRVEPGWYLPFRLFNINKTIKHFIYKKILVDITIHTNDGQKLSATEDCWKLGEA